MKARTEELEVELRLERALREKAEQSVVDIRAEADRAQAEAAGLIELLNESFRVDGRLTPDYENGWNAAVSWIIERAQIGDAGKALLAELEQLRAGKKLGEANAAWRMAVRAAIRLCAAYGETDEGVKLLAKAAESAGEAFEQAEREYRQRCEQEAAK